MERYLADIEAEANRRDAAASLNHCSACGQDLDLTDRANPTLCYPCFHERQLRKGPVHRLDLAITNDLSIPDFLLRQQPQIFAEAA
jgi:recombinational DNA repair protein (RecF pathway)